MLFTFLFFLPVKGIEVYKSKAGTSNGPDKYKQYSVIRTNANDGFIYAGTTKNANGDDNIHVMKTDNSFGTTWSFMYSEVQDHHLHATGICRMTNGNGYWLSGYWRDGVNDNLPFIMELDENGSVVRHMMGEQGGVFLDIAATEDNGCVATGFLSDVITEPAANGRRGLLVKFDDTLGIQWSFAFHAQFRANGDNWHYETGENVLVINNDNTNNQDYYFVSGSVSDIEPNGWSNGVDKSMPNLYYMYVDNNGGLIYKHTTREYGSAFDIAYDVSEHKVYYVGKVDVKPSDYFCLVGRIDVSTGNLDYQKYFEGDYQGFPYVHSPIPYKVEVSGDNLYMFGYVRAFNYDAGTSSTDVMIPYWAILDKSDASQIDFGYNHSNMSYTVGYPSEDPGYLHAWDNYIGIFEQNFPSVYGPEMGLIYLDQEDQLQWAMVGYFDQDGAPIRYDLHLLSSENGECEPQEHDLNIGDEDQDDIETIYVNANFTFRRMYIVQTSVSMNDDDCE